MILAACDGVQFVDRVILVNRTDYPANVGLRDETGGSLGLATVPAESTREIREVIDQGTTWTFRFSYGGHEPLEVTLTKRELIAADWRVEVPLEFEQQLRQKGVIPPR